MVPLAQICAQKCSWILPLLDAKTSKNLVLGLILAIWPKFGLPVFFFFFKKMAPLVTRYHGQLSSDIMVNCHHKQYQKKLSDGQTDGQTDRQTRVIS